PCCERDPRDLPARPDRPTAGRRLRARARHGRVGLAVAEPDLRPEARDGGGEGGGAGMTLAASERSSASSSSSRADRTISRLTIATINRPEGDTGVHTHTRVLESGLRDAGVSCDVVSAFSGSRKWLPLFAVRPLLLHRIIKSWSTWWHRKWHGA